MFHGDTVVNKKDKKPTLVAFSVGGDRINVNKHTDEIKCAG